MALYADTLHTTKTQTSDGLWHVAKPLPDTFMRRLFDAWHVLTGKYVAVYFFEEEADDYFY